MSTVTDGQLATFSALIYEDDAPLPSTLSDFHEFAHEYDEEVGLNARLFTTITKDGGKARDKEAAGKPAVQWPLHSTLTDSSSGLANLSLSQCKFEESKCSCGCLLAACLRLDMPARHLMGTNATLRDCSACNIVLSVVLPTPAVDMPYRCKLHVFMSAVFVFMGTHSSRPTPFIKGQMKQNKALQEDKEGEDLNLMRAAGGERCGSQEENGQSGIVPDEAGRHGPEPGPGRLQSTGMQHPCA